MFLLYTEKNEELYCYIGPRPSAKTNSNSKIWEIDDGGLAISNMIDLRNSTTS